MDKLSVIETRTVGSYTIKRYDLEKYSSLSDANQERIWRRLASITMLECLPFGEGALMEYLEVAKTFECAFDSSNKLVAFQLVSEEQFTDPEDTDTSFSIFTCPYEHEAFYDPVERAQDVAAVREAAPPGKLLPKLPTEVESNIVSYLSGVKGATAKQQMEKLKEMSGRSRVNRKTRRSKGKRGTTKGRKLRNLSSRRR